MYIRFVNYLDNINQYRKSKISNRNFLIILAVIVGVLAGLAAAAIKSLTHHIEEFLQSDWHWKYKYYLYFIFPMIGIFLTVLYIKYFIRKSKFETGLTPLLYAISKKSSRVEAHNIYSQIITAAITVGFGGSTGLEAPIVTSGASIGSNLGRFLGLSYREITMLVACGAAAGIAGAFNSPVAGIVFAIEILLPEFTIPAFIPLLLSAATAAVVARIFYTQQLFFLVTEGWQINALFYYVLLAGLIGLFSIYFTKANYAVKGLFYKIKHPYTKVVVGGLMLGFLVFLFPTLYGEGYITMKNLLRGDYLAVINNSIFESYNSIPPMVVLFTVVTIFMKSLATLITLGAGGNGGTFAPSLIMGGLIGFIFAYVVNLSGLAHLNVSNFIVAGMAAALGSIMHAPLTGIFLIAEITGGYILMVPLMITTAISYAINRSSQKHSIYTKVLADKGELLSHEDKDTTVLNQMKLKYLIEKTYPQLQMNDQIALKMNEIVQSHKNICAVTDETGDFKGIIYIEELFSQMVNHPDQENLLATNLVQAAPNTVIENDDLKVVLQKMEQDNVWVLPVTDEANHYKGFVSKTAIFNKYRALLMRQNDYMS
ncbi:MULTISPECIES: chloride channel protein [unclassified Pedobacter]|uniref:chloride channel protein n=1 Tax=Pedobacter TaxID=84567 RepID=UPI000B4BCCFD|nr:MULTISPECIES: chloride channel protein [unclassified Pedobacter]MCX2585638.1 chloride channel protein [Pedobacter sp. MR22-3]OWK70257.1 chloride channel protein [Pedobacter sp. AJM]